MERKEIYDRIVNIIKEKGFGDDVTEDKLFSDDMGMDSMDFVEIIMESEREFSMTIPDEDAEVIKTVRELVNYIEENI